MPKRIVVKLGTSVLTGGTTRLHHPQMVNIARQCAALQAQQHELIICTSGAIAAGRELLGFPALPNTITTKQMLAAVGQSQLMQMWGRFFAIYDIQVGQILLTRSDIESRQSYLNARDTLRALLEHSITPVINENDAIATDEIKVGDNDNLSALLSVLAEADLLLLLTDQEGLFTADPRHDRSAQLIREVKAIDDELRAFAGDSVSGLGTGGMATKLSAADLATRAGTEVIIANGYIDDVILRLARGESLGTRFVARDNPIENRKRWLLTGATTSGRIIIDAGAEQALRYHGRSLLPAGITGVEGDFTRGSPITIANKPGDAIARGVARYSSRSLRRLSGCQSNEIEARLGYSYGKVAVHRNDLVLL